MKISISNIIWKKGKNEFAKFIEEVKKNGIFAIELSLNSIFEEPLNMTAKDFQWLEKQLETISVSAIHSLTYTRPDLNIFDNTRNELIEYIKFYIKVANKLGTKNIVFGSAQSRNIKNISKAKADLIFIEFLKELDENLQNNNVFLHIEPLPKTYCNYLNSFLEGVSLLENETFLNIFIQLDIKSIFESDEDIKKIFKYSKYIKHVHASNPNFEILGNEFAEKHKQIKKLLEDVNYSNFVSGEILNKSGDNYPLYLQSALESLKEFYG
ncbi:sugar phosphate isomerase/epimerase [Thiovulum sp. ES]|nr:sugar phosphate isomerase/epimerase [Thiovulum sp. ES]